MSQYRIALALEYNGRNYHGWQLQAKSAVPTVQQALEHALARVAAHPVRTICAGRTDTGVHATAQIVHFDSDVERSPRQWTRGANTYLPKDVRVRWAQPVSHEFHARFSASSRRYRYFIINTQVRSAIFAGQQTHVYAPLNVDLMQVEAELLHGQHDFTSYRAVACQAKSPVRRIETLRVVRRNNVIMLDIKANAFLQHMVRNIAGVLIAVGSGKESPGWARTVLEAKNRCAGGVTATPDGLYLVKVDYPSEFDLPELPLGPDFF